MESNADRTKCTRNRFHGNDARWWNLPKRPGVKAEGLVDFFSQTGGMWHSILCLFVTELLRLPFACYSFQLFAGDSFFFYYYYYFAVVVLLKMFRSISGVDINALLSECEIPLAVRLFPTSLFFLVVKGLLRLSSWYPEKDILFRRSNQNMYIKFQNKMI